MTEIVAPIVAPDAATLVEACSQARREGATAVEVRLDTCADRGADLNALVDAFPGLDLPVLATLRHASEGGTWSGQAGERRALYERADAAGARWVDVELAQDDGWRPTRAGLVLSHHDFTGMGSDQDSIIARMHAAGAAVAKIALTPADADDLAIIARIYRHAQGPCCAIAMGETGLPSRLLAGCWGAAFTFGRLSTAPGSAPGQPLVEDLARRYRIGRQGRNTRIFGVIGKPIGHSLSPLIHNAAITAHDLDAVYVPFLVQDPVRFWKACGRFIDGLSITIPHKHDLIPLMDSLEPLVERIGAMNTIWRDAEGRTVGANTDAVAAMTCVEGQAGTLRGRKVTLLGAGGVSRAIAFALADRGAQVTIANRNPDRAATLAAEVGCRNVGYAEAANQSYDVLINGTSVGMEAPDDTPWPTPAHRREAVVFDTVYVPLETRLIKEAQLAGAATVCGLSMFIGQAAEQYRRFFGRAAPTELMHRVALERLEAKQRTALRKPGTEGLEMTLGGG